MIHKDTVLHFRVPFSNDPGLDFIPGSHKRWDTEEERSVRLKLDGRMVHESLPGSVRVPHQPNDLLVFSAHLLHKGVYEGERCSFDIIFASFRQSSGSADVVDHFPDEAMRREIGNAKIFELK
jgi:hypothetical protein